MGGNPGGAMELELVDGGLGEAEELAGVAVEIIGPGWEEIGGHETVYILSCYLTNELFGSRELGMKSERSLPEEYRELRAQLGRVGWVALGSLVERGEPGQGGPRYQWSRRVEGKTVTVALSKEQFEWLQHAIQNQREAWDILSKMHRITLDYMWKNLPNTSRRKRLTKKTLGIN